jgi:hypothetical protein
MKTILTRIKNSLKKRKNFRRILMKKKHLNKVRNMKNLRKIRNKINHRKSKKKKVKLVKKNLRTK